MTAGPTAHRFPLVARSRPLCTALPARIGALSDLAAKARHDNDLTTAARVYNQAALIASDCGQPDLARQWCHQHARAWLTRPDLDTVPGRYVLEPLVNLARLHIRAGNHDDGFNLLTGLYQAVASRTDTTIDGVPLPATALTPTPEVHADLTRWLWSVHLADGTRALTSAGRWCEAEEHLQQRHGIGRRMLDGRQVAIIAHIQRGQQAAALQMIDQAQPGEAWEAAVTACLTAMCRTNGQSPSADLARMARHYRAVATEPAQIVFRTRVALTITDISGGPAVPELVSIAPRTAEAAVEAADGYAARDILASPTWSASLPADTRRALVHVLAASGLDRPLPVTLRQRLAAALRRCHTTIADVADLRAGVQRSRSQDVTVRLPDRGQWTSGMDHQ